MTAKSHSSTLFLLGTAVLCAITLIFLLSGHFWNSDRPVEYLTHPEVANVTMHFAIADFDGDRQPDLATIHVTREGPLTAEYSVDLSFSSGAREPIGITGPAGGLQLTPQDVNGDKIDDLVVTSLLDSQFVAVLLNDGKGNFELVDRDIFPSAGKQPSSSISTPNHSVADPFTLGRARGTQGEEGRPTSWQGLRQVSYDGVPSSSVRAPADFVFSSAGRSPPFIQVL
jgi:hypothetical protein